MKYLSIGDMSKATNVSIQTLRYYDRMNLFKPEYINPENNYRYYTIGQIFYLDIIKYLRHLGTSLKEIKEAIALPPEKLQEFLSAQEQRIDLQIENLKQTKILLAAQQAQLSEQLILNHLDKGMVYQRKIAERTMLKLPCQNVVTPLDQPDLYFRELADILEKNQLLASLQYGCIFPLQKYDSLAGIHYSSIFTNLYKSNDNFSQAQVETLDAGNYLCICFSWSTKTYLAHFNQLLTAYQNLHLEKKADVFEVSLPNNLMAQHEEDFITELQIKLD